MNSNVISRTIILVGGLFLGMVMANMAVTDRGSSLLWFGVAAVVFTGVALGRNIWMLIPVAYGLSLTLLIPGRPTTIILGSGIFLAFASLMVLMRRLPWRGSLREMDLLIILVGLTILQVYLRNPVGFNLLGGSSVGGRPYVLIAIGFVTYFFLANYIVPPHQLKLILKLTVVGAVINFILSGIGYFVPGLGMWYGAASVSSNPNESTNGTSEGVAVTGIGSATRVTFLASVSANLALTVAAFRSPLTAILHPAWGLGVIASIAMAAVSGFRNSIIAVGMTYLVAIAYRSGFAGLVVSSVCVALGLGVLTVANTIHPLPSNVQRSLSFLPGNWSEDIMKDANGSTEWRVEIWKEVMLTDRWIRNKYFGDGLGFSAQELAMQKDISYKIMSGQSHGASLSGFDFHRDAILANGDYHSGPIQTIRVVGYFGLLILLITQFRLAVHAHRQIKRCRGTEFYPLALFVGIPLIYSPVFFITVFGSFELACGIIFLGAAYVKIMENNLPLNHYGMRSTPADHDKIMLAERS